MTEIQRFGTDATHKRPDTVVFGIGGAGRNILSSMLDDAALTNIKAYEVGESERIPNCSFIKINKSDMRKAYESGLYLGMSPMSNSERNLKDKIENNDVVYFLSGLGGETGSWTTPVCSYLSKQTRAFTIIFTATPFKQEGPSRNKFADESKDIIKRYADVIAVFDNTRLLEMNRYLPMTEAFEVLNSIIRLPVKEFNAVLTKSDIPYLKRFCRGVNEFRIGAGYGKGIERGKKASKEAFRSPWFDDPREYETILAVVASGKGSAELEAQDALEIIKEECPNADIMWGLRKDADIGDRTRVTILAGK